MRNIFDMYYNIYTAGKYKTHKTFRKQTAFVFR